MLSLKASQCTIGDEELPMTFQVAMIGSDGLLVGSDRKCIYRSQEPNRPASFQFEAGDKFVSTIDGSTVCFFAGGPQAKSIADAIISRSSIHQLPVPHWHAELQRTSETILANSIGDEVMVVRLSGSCADIALINKVGMVATVSTVHEHRCTGVNVNARFLTQEFWSLRSVESLQKLAIITMGYSARERPTEVGFGFNLMILKDGVVKWESYAEDDCRIKSACDDFYQKSSSAVFSIP